ncbi:MAG: 30S ribosomal protein S12 methylthiotransferase RimO [Defluviitaleaceae bacterium]|nr:30S ribosomal protein S12 methylthiotransferase RimO [Defluviitaleaceae bacterium]
MTVYFHSLGCDKNLVDSEIMLGLLYEVGYKSVSDPRQADMIVVNTCGFIQEAVEEGIEAILELAIYKEEGQCKKLIVTGCMAQRYREEIIKEIPEVDEILGVNDFPKIVGKDIDILDDELYEKRAATMPLHVAYVKISEGCDNHCTYCTIPSIRGSYRSRKFESIIKECARLIKGGAKELILVAQDTALYGTDLYNQPRLHELVEAIAALDNFIWVRIMYAYPEHIYTELIDVIANIDNVCSYLDMPIQHSHDSVIARMGRKNSTSEGLKVLIAQLQEKSIVIRTTLIAGFPGETEEEFEHLYQFVEEMAFNHLGVFTYSQEEGTPAATMEPQIDAEIKKNRQDKLMTLQASIAEKNGQKLIGQVLKIMVDGNVGKSEDPEMEESTIAYIGRSQREAYEIDGSVFFSSQAEWLSGDFVYVKITKAVGYDLYGELTEV